MLIDDGISGIWEIKMQGLKGYWRSFGFENFYYGHYAIVAMLYGLFGLKPIGWFLFFIGMHALNSTLLFMVGKKCFALVSANAEAVLMALCSAILFLISPYQSENIIWAATSHYCVSLFILLVSLYWLIQSMEGRKPFSNILLHALLAFSLLTLEISFLFPPLLLAFYFLFKILNKNKLSLKEYFIGVLLPQSVLVCIYCGFHKYFFHTWIPHDRASAETLFSLPHAISTLSQQVVKLFGFVHFLHFEKRELIYSALLHWKKVLAVLLLFVSVLLFFLYRKQRSKSVLAFFLMLGALLMYAPFLRLYFMYLARIENDRYNYFASVFLFSLFVLILFQFHKYIRYSVLLLYFGGFALCLFPVVSARKHSARLHQQFLKQLPVDTATGKLYILNVPASCKDAYLFRAEGRLGIAYQTLYGKNIFDQVEQVAWYNAQSENDAFEVKKLNDTTYHVQIKTNGSWWMHESMGASDRMADAYRIELDEWGGYQIIFKRPLPTHHRIAIYSEGRFIIL
ncbi:MAG: hypothetical protein IPK62_02010 [Bacteroidetes bacterium]|nr:hypothetical protein [Bacteroidota bacterium]